jgi:hypothetical protein
MSIIYPSKSAGLVTPSNEKSTGPPSNEKEDTTIPSNQMKGSMPPANDESATSSSFQMATYNVFMAYLKRELKKLKVKIYK